MADSTSDVLAEVQSGDKHGLAAAAKFIPGTTTKNPRPETLYRWCTSGARAADGTRTKLEHVRVGSRIVTSRAAIQRFLMRLTSGTTAPAPTVRTPAQRRRDHERAEKELEAAGW